MRCHTSCTGAELVLTNKRIKPSSTQRALDSNVLIVKITDRSRTGFRDVISGRKRAVDANKGQKIYQNRYDLRRKKKGNQNMMRGEIRWQPGRKGYEIVRNVGNWKTLSSELDRTIIVYFNFVKDFVIGLLKCNQHAYNTGAPCWTRPKTCSLVLLGALPRRYKKFCSVNMIISSEVELSAEWYDVMSLRCDICIDFISQLIKLVDETRYFALSLPRPSFSVVGVF